MLYWQYIRVPNPNGSIGYPIAHKKLSSWSTEFEQKAIGGNNVVMVEHFKLIQLREWENTRDHTNAERSIDPLCVCVVPCFCAQSGGCISLIV